MHCVIRSVYCMIYLVYWYKVNPSKAIPMRYVEIFNKRRLLIIQCIANMIITHNQLVRDNVIIDMIVETMDIA